MKPNKIPSMAATPKKTIKSIVIPNINKLIVAMAIRNGIEFFNVRMEMTIAKEVHAIWKSIRITLTIYAEKSPKASNFIFIGNNTEKAPEIVANNAAIKSGMISENFQFAAEFKLELLPSRLIAVPKLVFGSLKDRDINTPIIV